jgi:hypothetical protein
MAAYLHTPLLGLLIAMVLSFLLRHSGVLRVLAVVCLLGAGVLVLAMGVFALDVVQMRATTPLEARPSFQVGALLAEAKHFTGFVTLAFFGLGGWKAAGHLSSMAKASEPKGRTGDVVGMPKGI